MFLAKLLVHQCVSLMLVESSKAVDTRERFQPKLQEGCGAVTLK